MPNHVHLLVEGSSTPLSKFMQGLQRVLREEAAGNH
jgi:hypothetical protein